jgi:hypothetical protein
MSDKYRNGFADFRHKGIKIWLIRDSHNAYDGLLNWVLLLEDNLEALPKLLPDPSLQEINSTNFSRTHGCINETRTDTTH